MSAVLLDTNVLLALAWPNHQHHGAAQRWFRKEAPRGWATCALTQLGFVRLSSNPAYTPAAVSPSAAAELLKRLTSHGRHQYWADLAPADAGVFGMAIGHRQVMDAYLVREAERHRCRLVTFDRRITVHTAKPGTVVILAPGG